MTPADNNLLQIARLRSVDSIYTLTLKYCGAGLVVGVFWYVVVFFAAGS